MRIRFQDRSIRDLCERQREAQRELGNEAASNLRSILSDFEVVSNLDELRFRNLITDTIDGVEQIYIRLSDKIILRFKSVLSQSQETPKENLSWDKVNTIKITKIGIRDEQL